MSPVPEDKETCVGPESHDDGLFSERYGYTVHRRRDAYRDFEPNHETPPPPPKVLGPGPHLSPLLFLSSFPFPFKLGTLSPGFPETYTDKNGRSRLLAAKTVRTHDGRTRPGPGTFLSPSPTFFQRRHRPDVDCFPKTRS